jgi:hypothetical protein
MGSNFHQWCLRNRKSNSLKIFTSKEIPNFSSITVQTMLPEQILVIKKLKVGNLIQYFYNK